MVTQGQNHIDSPANMLQQQHSYEVSDILLLLYDIAEKGLLSGEEIFIKWLLPPPCYA